MLGVGDGEGDGGAVAGAGIDLEGAVDEGGALAHAGDAEAGLDGFGGHADAVVADGEDGGGGFEGEVDLDVGGAAVSGGVGEGFLGDAEEDGFDGFGEAAGGEVDVEGDPVAVGGVHLVDDAADGADGAEFVEDAGAKAVADAADVADGVAEDAAEAEGAFVGVDALFDDGVGGEGGGGEDLADAVVEFLSEEAALTFEEPEGAVGEGAEGLGGVVEFLAPLFELFVDEEVLVGVGDGDGGEAGEPFDGGLVVVGEGLVVGFVGEVDCADVALAMGNGNAEEGGHGGVMLGDAGGVGFLVDVVDADALGASEDAADDAVSFGGWSDFGG